MMKVIWFLVMLSGAIAWMIHPEIYLYAIIMLIGSIEMRFTSLWQVLDTHQKSLQLMLQILEEEDKRA